MLSKIIVNSLKIYSYKDTDSLIDLMQYQNIKYKKKKIIKKKGVLTPLIINN